MTVQNILDDIDLRLPNPFAANTKIGWINNCIRKYAKDLTSTALYTFNTTDNQAYYSYSTDMVPELIQKLEIASSASSTSYSEYTFSGQNDSLEGAKWLNEATTDDVMQLRIYPTPSTTVEVKVYYESKPTEVTQSSDIIDVADEYIDLIKFNVMKVIAQSGNVPDIELANNYDREEDRILHNIRMDRYKKKQQLPKETKTYKDVFWSGW